MTSKKRYYRLNAELNEYEKNLVKRTALDRGWTIQQLVVRAIRRECEQPAPSEPAPAPAVKPPAPVRELRPDEVVDNPFREQSL